MRGDGINSIGIETNAIRISFNDVEPLGGGLLFPPGDILIGRSRAFIALMDGQPVPEPGVLGLLGLGLAAAVSMRRRRTFS